MVGGWADRGTGCDKFKWQEIKISSTNLQGNTHEPLSISAASLWNIQWRGLKNRSIHENYLVCNIPCPYSKIPFHVFANHALPCHFQISQFLQVYSHGNAIFPFPRLDYSSDSPRAHRTREQPARTVSWAPMSLTPGSRVGFTSTTFGMLALSFFL